VPCITATTFTLKKQVVALLKAGFSNFSNFTVSSASPRRAKDTVSHVIKHARTVSARAWTFQTSQWTLIIFAGRSSFSCDKMRWSSTETR